MRQEIPQVQDLSPHQGLIILPLNIIFHIPFPFPLDVHHQPRSPSRAQRWVSSSSNYLSQLLFDMINNQDLHQPIQSKQQPSFASSYLKLFDNLQLVHQSSLDSIRVALKQDPENSQSLLILYVFGSKSNLQKVDQDSLLISKAICARLVNSQEKSYMCYDCGNNSPYHMYCSGCFEKGFAKGQHENHRYLITTVMVGCCDCGDINVFEPSAFCQDHQGYSKIEKELDKEITKRLQEALLVVFDQFFLLCEQKSQAIVPRLAQKLQQVQNSLMILELDEKIEAILGVLKFFITEFCQNLILLKNAIAQFLTKPINIPRFHTCEMKSFTQFFKDPEEDEEHLCQLSIVDLILIYSNFYQKYEEFMSTILYSLFENQEYKLSLVDAYFKNYRFLNIAIQIPEDIYYKIPHNQQLYSQFLGPEFTRRSINNVNFSNYTDVLRQQINIINSSYSLLSGFESKLKLVLLSYEKFIVLCERHHLTDQLFILLKEILKMSNIINNFAYSYIEMETKLWITNTLIELMRKIVSAIDYTEQKNRSNVESILLSYLQTYERKQFQKHQFLAQGELTNGEFEWNIMGEVSIGFLIVSLFDHFGKEYVSEILQPLKSTSNFHGYIRTLISVQLMGYNAEENTDVGFPNQKTPKEIYLFQFKNAQTYLFNTIISTLQIFCLTTPDQMVKQFVTMDLQQMARIMVDIVLEETCLINTTAQVCQKPQGKLVKNGLKLVLINIFNQRSKLSLDNFKQTYCNSLFWDKVPWNQVVEEVADFDNKTKLFSIKEQFRGLKDGILLRRCDQEFASLFQKQSPLEMIYSDTLFSYARKETWASLGSAVACSLASESDFVLLRALIGCIWKSQPSHRNYEELKLMMALLNECQREWIEKARALLAKQGTTKIQLSLLKLMKSMGDKQQAIVEVKVEKASKANRMKHHLQKMKKQQSAFEANNQDLINEMVQLSNKDAHQEQMVCLICHESDSKGISPSFVFSTKLIQIKAESVFSNLTQNMKIDVPPLFALLSTCSHYYHESCMAQQKMVQCRICKLQIAGSFLCRPSSQLTLHSANQPRFMSFHPDIKIEPPSFFRDQIIQSLSLRVYFSILQPFDKFQDNQTSKLRNILCSYVSHSKEQSPQSSIDSLQSIPTPFYSNVIINYVLLLQCVFLDSLSLDSVQLKRSLEKTVSRYYSEMIAFNLAQFTQGVEIEKDQELSLFKVYEEPIKARLNQFSKGIILAYSVLFQDQRLAVLNSIKEEDKLTETLSAVFPELFKIHEPTISLHLKAIKGSNKEIEFQHPLLSISNLLTPPENYLLFNSKFNTLKCSQCKEFIAIRQNMNLMCMLCGYRCCDLWCGTEKPENGMRVSIQMHLKKHGNEGIILDINSCELYIFSISNKGVKRFLPYGRLFQNKEGVSDPNKELDWTSLRLNHQKWSRLLELYRRRQLREEANSKY